MDWGSTFPTYMSKLESLQNKAVKIKNQVVVLPEKPNSIYGQLKILKLTDLYEFEIAKLVHDFSWWWYYQKSPTPFTVN